MKYRRSSITSGPKLVVQCFKMQFFFWSWNMPISSFEAVLRGTDANLWFVRRELRLLYSYAGQIHKEGTWKQPSMTGFNQAKSTAVHARRDRDISLTISKKEWTCENKYAWMLITHGWSQQSSHTLSSFLSARLQWHVDNLNSQRACNFQPQFATGRQFAVQLWLRVLMLTVCRTL